MKTNVLILFGGRSSEHAVSRMSAGNVARALDKTRYEAFYVYITRNGLWRYVTCLPDQVDDTFDPAAAPEAAILPGEENAALLIRGEGDQWKKQPIDIAIPVLHGKNGEDGTIQGLLEIARLPYVGCGVLASAASMDKLTTKRIVSTLGIRQADYEPVFLWELSEMDKVVERIESHLPYPVYVKPANAGSSIGVTRATDRESLIEGLKIAADNDSRILVEEGIVGREIECAVLGNEHPKASGIGEILAADTFYTYEAKYFNDKSETVLDPDLPEKTVEEIRKDACAVFRAVDGKGLSRVDFFVEKATGEVIFNEINTFPGFTKISMYPMLWANRGLTYPQLVDELIQLGLQR